MPSPSHQSPQDGDTATLLDRLAAAENTQSNCMFHLAIMLARIALEPCAEAYKGTASQALLGIIRDKPRSNVVRLFGGPTAADVPSRLSASV